MTASIEDVDKFEKLLFKKQTDIILAGKIDKEFGRRMGCMCNELAALIKLGNKVYEQRVEKLREIYSLMREFGYDIPN